VGPFDAVRESLDRDKALAIRSGEDRAIALKGRSRNVTAYALNCLAEVGRELSKLDGQQLIGTISRRHWPSSATRACGPQPPRRDG
jgi:hypothetical protein